MYSYLQARFCKFPKQHNCTDLVRCWRMGGSLMVHMSILELNFLHKQPLKSPCVTLDGRLTSKVCTALKGSPYSRRRKECFGLNSREGCQRDLNPLFHKHAHLRQAMLELVLWIHTMETLCATAPLLSHDNLLIYILSGLSPTFSISFVSSYLCKVFFSDSCSSSTGSSIYLHCLGHENGFILNILFQTLIFFSMSINM